MPPASEGQKPTTPVLLMLEKKSTLWLITALVGVLLLSAGAFVICRHFFYCDPVDCDPEVYVLPANGVASTTDSVATSTISTSVSQSQIGTTPEIHLGISQGLEGGTSYILHAGSGILVYSSWAPVDQHTTSTSTLSSGDWNMLAGILAKYNLATITSDGLPPPDGGNTTLDISGMPNGIDYHYHFLSSDNPGLRLVQDLQNFFESVGAKTSGESGCGPTENCDSIVPYPSQLPVQATVSDSCAPWDGHALALSMTYNGGAFSAVLFGKGIDLFESGKPVVINELDDSTTGTGLASSCFNGSNSTTTPASRCFAYNAGDVEIVNRTPFTEPNIPKSFNVVIKGVTVPVEATWVVSHQMCG